MQKVAGTNRLRIAGFAVASSLALTLAACGGGGGDSFVESTPPPPVLPPPPPPSPFAISAPARATVGTGMAPVLADAAGPNFTTGAVEGTVFPLLQTTVSINESSIKPDASVNTVGGTATATATGLAIGIADLVAAPSTIDPNLDWTRVGSWAFDESPWDYSGFPSQRGVFVTGYETPEGAMPTTGSATFSGSANGSMFAPASMSNGLPCRCTEVQLTGTASFTADFGARSLDGALTEMGIIGGWDGESTPWNDVTFTSTIVGNSFSGTTSVTTSPAGAMGLNATGTLEGRFFGPSAQEAGAVWTLFDGTNAAIGTLSGRRGP